MEVDRSPLLRSLTEIVKILLLISHQLLMLIAHIYISRCPQENLIVSIYFRLQVVITDDVDFCVWFDLF